MSAWKNKFKGLRLFYVEVKNWIWDIFLKKKYFQNDFWAKK